MTRTVKYMECRTQATLIHCNAEFVRKGKHVVHIFEPLHVSAGPDLHPYCCLSDTVIFYDDDYYEIDRTHHHDLNHVYATCVLLNDGRWYEILSGRVDWREGRWCMVWLAVDNRDWPRRLNGEKD